MGISTVQGRREPITFADAPTVERDGRRYLTNEAAVELGDQLAARYGSLLQKLSQE